jgi:rRNA maturation RNase YbeY
MKIQLHNPQTKHPLNLPAIQQLATWLGARIQSPHQPWGEITLLLTDDPGITHYNQQYFAKNHPTDVISFRHDPIPGEPNHLTGDLIINIQRAHQEGTRLGNRDFELAFYIAHGFDHLNGATDETPEKRNAMHRREKKWLQQANELNLPNQLFQPEP